MQPLRRQQLRRLAGVWGNGWRQAATAGGGGGGTHWVVWLCCVPPRTRAARRGPPTPVARARTCAHTPPPPRPHTRPPTQPQDGRTLRYPDPLISRGDTVKIDLATGKVTDFVKFEVGNTVMVTGGRNTGRIGTLVKVDRHPGSFDIVAVKDAEGTTFATRRTNVFTIGKGGDIKNALVSLPKGKGIKKTIFDERTKRLGKA